MSERESTMARFPISRIAIAAVFLACAATAQEPPRTVAMLHDIAGNALVSKESGLGAGAEGLRLAPGTRVITTSRSRAVVVYDDGCEVKLDENERFEVETGKPCAALVAMVQPMIAAPAAVAGATAGAASAYAIALPALGVAGVAALRSRRESQPVSPS